MRKHDVGDMSYGRRVVNTRASGVVVLLSVTKACAMMRLTDPLKPAMDAKTTSLVDKSLNHQDIYCTYCYMYYLYHVLAYLRYSQSDSSMQHLVAIMMRTTQSMHLALEHAKHTSSRVQLKSCLSAAKKLFLSGWLTVSLTCAAA